MDRNNDDNTDVEIATVDAAGRPAAERLRAAHKQLTIVLDALEAEGDDHA